MELAPSLQTRATHLYPTSNGQVCSQKNWTKSQRTYLFYSPELDSPPYITTRQGEYSDSEHTAKQIVYSSKRTDGKLLLLKICKSRKWLITCQYLPLLKDGILHRVTVPLYLSKPTYRAKEKIMKKHYIKKETVLHHISHTVEKKISTEIFSTNFKVFDICTFVFWTSTCALWR